MKSGLERIYNGLIKENPVLVLMLGMCPTLAVTTSASNGFGMGVSTMAVLIVSNLIISALCKAIPDEVRLPAYIVIVASLVTVMELLTQAFVYDLYKTLGIFIPLIVVNCIILGRTEAFALVFAGCGAACPKGLISLIPAQGVLSVNRSSHDKGPAVRKVCAEKCPVKVISGGAVQSKAAAS